MTIPVSLDTDTEALEICGGVASRGEIEAGSRLDLRLAARKHTPPWKLVVRRARRAMTREKYLEDAGGKQW
jgi:hypothetical protein